MLFSWLTSSFTSSTNVLSLLMVSASRLSDITLYGLSGGDMLTDDRLKVFLILCMKVGKASYILKKGALL